MKNVPCGIEKNVGRSVPENVGVGHVGVGCYDNRAREVPDTTNSFVCGKVKSGRPDLDIWRIRFHFLGILEIRFAYLLKPWTLSLRLNHNFSG